MHNFHFTFVLFVHLESVINIKKKLFWERGKGWITRVPVLKLWPNRSWAAIITGVEQHLKNLRETQQYLACVENWAIF